VDGAIRSVSPAQEESLIRPFSSRNSEGPILVSPGFTLVAPGVRKSGVYMILGGICPCTNLSAFAWWGML